MKNTFLVLLCLNAAFFLWLYGQPSTKDATPPPQTPVDVSTLELYTPEPVAKAELGVTGSQTSSSLPVVKGASEPLALNAPTPNLAPVTPSPKPLPLSVMSDTPSTPTTSVAQAETHNRACVWVGPIADKGRAEAAQEYLTTQGYQAHWEERPHTGGAVKFAYRVFIPPYPSFKEAKAATDTLKEKGIKDFYLITKSETKQYAISLGVFSRMAGVNVRSEQVKKFGFKTDYEIRERDQDTVFWVSAERVDSLPAKDKAALAVYGIDLTYTKKNCASE